MRFEKWQALGNDYAIVEERELGIELTPARVRALCAPHTGVGSDGVLLLDEPSDSAFVADLRIFNPDGSEAELSGNGVREAVMYLRRSGWTEHDTFSVSTAAGEVRPRITGERTCTVDMGRARLNAPDFPAGATTAAAPSRPPGRTLEFQFVSIGNPQCAIEAGDELEEPRPVRARAARSRATSCFPTAPTSRSGAGSPTTPSARAYSSAGWGRPCRRARAPRVLRWPRCSRGLDSPVTVHLDGGELTVEVGEDMHVDLSGWAVPVYRGTLSDEFVEELNAVQ